MMTNTDRDAALAAVLTSVKTEVNHGDYVAFTTTVAFQFAGRRYAAVRYTRSDLGSAGVEIYTAEGEFLGYTSESDTALRATASTIMEWS